MGLFDTIRATLPCPACGSTKERKIQTKQGPCLMLHLEVGDTIEPFYYGDYWIEEEWDCEECREQVPEETRWHKVFIHCVSGLVVEVTPNRPLQGKLPEWDLIHTLSRDRRRFRETLMVIRNSILRFRERIKAGGKERMPLLDIGPKTVDELLDRIVDHVERAKRGESPGWF